MGQQQTNGTQKNCSASRLAVLGFMEVGLVSRCLANHHACAHSGPTQGPSGGAHVSSPRVRVPGWLTGPTGWCLHPPFGPP